MYNIHTVSPSLRTIQTQRLLRFYKGSGGVERIIFGGAFQVLPKVHVGFMAQYNFGNIEMSVLTDATSHLAQGQQTIVSDGFSGGYGKLGFQFTGVPNLTIGLVAGAGLPMTVIRSSEYKFSSGLRDTTQRILCYSTSIRTWSGPGYTFNRVTLLADVSTKDFSTITYRTRRPDVSFSTCYAY